MRSLFYVLTSPLRFWLNGPLIGRFPIIITSTLRDTTLSGHVLFFSGSNTGILPVMEPLKKPKKSKNKHHKRHEQQHQNDEGHHSDYWTGVLPTLSPKKRTVGIVEPRVVLPKQVQKPFMTESSSSSVQWKETSDARYVWKVKIIIILQNVGKLIFSEVSALVESMNHKLFAFSVPIRILFQKSW